MLGACAHIPQSQEVRVSDTPDALAEAAAANASPNPAADPQPRWAAAARPTPPVAERRPHRVTVHGETLDDPYHWLRDQSYPTIDDADVLAYLEAENAYFEAVMAPRETLVETLFAEMRGRIKEDDSTVPQKDGDWVYWSAFDTGAQYRKHYRRPAGAAGAEARATLILDENQLAEGKEYFRLGAATVSRNGRYLAYSYDDDGSERFTIRIKDLETGELLPDAIPGTLTGPVWVANDTALVYGLATPEWRVDNARLHRLGTPVDADIELYKEADEGFRVDSDLSAQEDWLIISTGDNETSEVRLVRADDPTGPQVLVRPRQKGVEYSVDVREGTVFVLTNDEHVNFRLATAPLAQPGAWQTLIPGSDSFYLTEVSLFRDFFVTEGRRQGLDQIEVRSYSDPAAATPIAFPEASFVAGLSSNPEYATDRLRLSYQSMVTPGSVFDYHVADGRLELLKRQEIPSGYDPALYATERVDITARDGTRVPVSIVYRRDRDALNGGPGGPLHLYAYGSYGIAVPPGFSTSRLSLLDRGMAFAIAHVRGGDDLGRNWYLAGKLAQRTNTFTDFVDAARGLIAAGYTTPGRISASGGSAGGTVMGAVINSDPDLWGAVVAHVPFVDVLNTMLDGTLPLTPGEWPEWGDPITDRAAFETLRAYSPYDNVRAQDYPPLLITAGLNDPRVTYWEPAKWAARLRATKTDDNILLLKTNMGAGHGGKSGRFTALRETAEEYAFILWQLGLAP
ncbi:S9 family peptidase [Erythrobacteraceae bacterium CFH 75059]|nr:S9 family peptidase [Qipengyuania thermophila]TCD06940.1 S9 family peptidase [Erythrobacteraceae bacterium CFH 75059]